MQDQAVRKLFGRSRTAALDTLKSSVYYLTLTPKYDTIIEVNGNEFVIWRQRPMRHIDRVNRSSIQPFNVASLKSTLRQFDYRGEQVYLILHPPSVCLKSFAFAGNSPDKWLAKHLVEIAPPGNRRDLIMCFRQWQSSHLLVAFVRRSFLSELADQLRQSRISVKGIHVGGSAAVNILTRQTDQQCEHNIDFSLCRYTVTRINDAIQVSPQPLTANLVSRQSVASLHKPTLQADSIPLSTEKDIIDFKPQIGFPPALSSSALRKVVRSEFALILVLLVAVTLLHAFPTSRDSQQGSTEYRLTESRLLDLRLANQQMAKELDLAVDSRRPRYNACRFLTEVALSTPAQTWLTLISYSSAISGAGRTFNLKGICLNRDEPLRFADSLRVHHNVRIAAVTNAITDEGPLPRPTPEQPSGRVTRFEIIGEYANQ